MIKDREKVSSLKNAQEEIKKYLAFNPDIIDIYANNRYNSLFIQYEEMAASYSDGVNENITAANIYEPRRIAKILNDEYEKILIDELKPWKKIEELYSLPHKKSKRGKWEKKKEAIVRLKDNYIPISLRFKVDGEVLVKIDNKYYFVKVKNASGTGILIDKPFHSIKKGKKIKIIFRTGEKQMFQAHKRIGKIVRTPSKKIGIRFTKNKLAVQLYCILNNSLKEHKIYSISRAYFTQDEKFWIEKEARSFIYSCFSISCFYKYFSCHK